MVEISNGIPFSDQLRKDGSFLRGLASLRRGVLATILVLAILYGSLIPFCFDVQKLANGQIASFVPQFRDTSPEDIAVNVILYAGVSAALFSLSRRKGLIEGIGVVLLCAVLSFAAETMQAFIPQRVSSATDLFLNVAGAFLGVAACASMRTLGRKFSRGLGLGLRERPVNFWAIAISSALLAYHLIPFDFVTNTQQLHDSFRRVQLFDLPTGWSALTQELCAACWFAVVAFLIARQAREDGRLPIHSMIEGLQHGLILACLIECLQLFSRSHVPEVMSVVIRAAGALLGSWTAAFFVAGSPGVRRRPLSASTLLLAAAVQFLFLALTVCCKLQAPSGAPLAWRLRLPFKSLWLQPAPVAAASALSTMVIAFLLASTLAAALRRAGAPFYRATSCLFVTGVYLTAQVFTAFVTGNSFDPTDTILAALACGFALRAEEWFFTLDKSFVRS